MQKFVVVLQGGLGNRLFQYAFGYSFAKRNNMILTVMDLNDNHHSKIDYHKIFFPNIEYYNGPITKQEKQYGFSIYKNFQPDKNTDITQYIGYFQNEKYFKDYKEDIIKLLTPPESPYLKSKYPLLENSYFLHIRRGDYVGHEFLQLNLLDYYMECLSKISGHIYLFSDDPLWCLENIHYENKTIICENELDSLWLMSHCKKGGICSNSSFSWWGSYLNTNSDKLIYMPSVWAFGNLNEQLDIHPSYATIIPIEKPKSIINGYYWVNPIGKIDSKYKIVNTHEEAYTDAKKKNHRLILVLEGELVFQKDWEKKTQSYIEQLDKNDSEWMLLMLNSMGIIDWSIQGIRKAKDMYLKGGYLIKYNAFGKDFGVIQKENRGYFIFPFTILQKNNSCWDWVEQNFLPNFKNLFHTDNILYITYSDDKFKHESEQNLRDISFPKKLYGPSDIDPDFYQKHKEILKQSRGSGYWLWKPYFILKTLEENDIDYLIYCDAGTKITNWKNLFQNDITCFSIDEYEKSYNKMDLIEYLDCNSPDFLDSKQICASSIIIKKSPSSLQFIQSWLDLCCNPHFIDDSPSLLPNDPSFKDHRHDQSIFSLLCKKNGYIPLSAQSHIHHRYYCNLNLENLGRKYGTDKVSHGFCKNYDSVFHSIRKNFTKIAEIGVFFGSSILMWKDYFPLAHIYGLDAFLGLQGNGSSFQGFLDFYRKWQSNPDPRIHLIQLDQSQRSQLESFAESNFDMILDDASHLMKDQQQTLGVMFPLVKQGGYFIIEDVHSSIQEGYDVEGDNTTLIMLDHFQKTKKWKSKYMTENEMDYLNNHTSDIKLFNNNGSMTCIIKKL